MRHEINGFNHAELLLLGLDSVDSLILSSINHFSGTGRMKRVTVCGEEYFWVSHTWIMDELPIIKIGTKKAVSVRMAKYVDCGLMKKHVEHNNTTYYKFNDEVLFRLRDFPNYTITQTSPLSPKTTTPVAQNDQGVVVELPPKDPNTNIQENNNQEKKEMGNILFDAAKTNAEECCEPNKQHFASPEVVQVFDHWNNTSPLKHRKINDAMEKAISIRLKENSLDDLKTCISNYASVVTNTASWYTYQSSLDDFFRVGKLKPAPCMKFFPERFVLQNFLDKKKQNSLPVNGSRIIPNPEPVSRIV